MSLKVIEAKVEHIELLDLRDEDIEFYGENRVRFFTSLITVGGGFTVVKNGQLLAMFGNIQLWDGVQQLWLIPSIYLEANAVSFVRFLKEYFKAALRSGLGHRFQTETRTGEYYAKLMRSLGFTCESTMEMYYHNKENALLWAYVLREDS